MGLAYVIWQPTAFFQALRNGGYVSVGSWANPVFRFLDYFFMTGLHAKVVVGVISYVGLFVIGWMLSRVVPWTAAPGLREGCRSAAGSADHRAAYVAGAVGRLADHVDVHPVLVRPDRLDAAGRAGREQARSDHVARGSPRCRWPTCPAASIDVGPALDFTATRMRDTVSPIIQIAVLVAVVMWWKKPDRPELFPFGPGRERKARSQGPDRERQHEQSGTQREPRPPATPVRQRRQGRDPTGRDDSEDQGRSSQAAPQPGR